MEYEAPILIEIGKAEELIQGTGTHQMDADNHSSLDFD
jgi:hypothetical protein